MKNILLIGAGHFGRHIAMQLSQLGHQVMAVDTDEERINDVLPFVTKAQIGDSTNAEFLRALGIGNFDVCFVCITDNFQSSMEITSLLKELGAPCVVAKSNRDIHSDLLKKIGADDVVYPERDMARRTAVKYSAHGAFDYIELSPEYAIIEIAPPSDWVGQRINELGIRVRHNINVIGVRDGTSVKPLTSADHRFRKDEHIIIAGSQHDIRRILDNK